MQAFYEPAWFGPKGRDYGGSPFMSVGRGLPIPTLSGTPTTIGGFTVPSPSGYVRGTEIVGDELRNRDLTEAEKNELDRQWAARSAYEAPPLGMANLAQYGQGQLSNYGMGGMSAYQPMMREEFLRWR